jgi:hypothetical protein
MEMLSIFLRLLEKLIAESSWAAEDTIYQATAYAVPVLLEHVGDRRALTHGYADRCRSATAALASA